MRRKRRKYTRSMFHRAEKAIAEMAIHEETIRVWTKALEEIGKVDEKRVLALEVAEDGNVKVEFEPISNEHSDSELPTSFVVGGNGPGGTETL